MNTAEVGKSFVSWGTLVRPSIRGRIYRFVAGVIGLSATVLALLHPNWIIRLDTLDLAQASFGTIFGLVFLGLALVGHLINLNVIVNLAFKLNTGKYPLLIVGAMAAMALVADLLFFGTVWAAPLGIVVLMVLVYSTGHLGISHILAGILGTPGCEMRSIPHLVGILTGREVEEHFCPGSWTRMDERDAQRRAERLAAVR